MAQGPKKYVQRERHRETSPANTDETEEKIMKGTTQENNSLKESSTGRQNIPNTEIGYQTDQDTWLDLTDQTHEVVWHIGTDWDEFTPEQFDNCVYLLA